MIRYAAMHSEPEVLTGEPMWSRNLLAIYETDADIVASVLPQPLEVAAPTSLRSTCPTAHSRQGPSLCDAPATA